jgi:hypothetical protein
LPGRKRPKGREDRAPQDKGDPPQAAKQLKLDKGDPPQAAQLLKQDKGDPP